MPEENHGEPMGKPPEVTTRSPTATTALWIASAALRRRTRRDAGGLSSSPRGLRLGTVSGSGSPSVDQPKLRLVTGSPQRGVDCRAAKVTFCACLGRGYRGVDRIPETTWFFMVGGCECTGAKMPKAGGFS